MSLAHGPRLGPLVAPVPTEVPNAQSRVTVTVTVEFPMGEFDLHKTGSRYDVTTVIHEALTSPEVGFAHAEVRYVDA